MDHILILLTIMVASGSLGGLASYWSVIVDETEKHPILKRIGLGIAASFTVPLFLNMISSSILSNTTQDPINYLVFAGFCVVAGFSSKSFISSLSKRILDKLDSVEQKQQDLVTDVEPLLSKETEPEPDEQEPTEEVELNPKEIKIIKALANKKYSRRYLSGIEKETGIEDIEIVYHIITLREKGLVHSKKGKRLDLYWLTTLGRRQARKIEES